MISWMRTRYPKPLDEGADLLLNKLNFTKTFSHTQLTTVASSTRIDQGFSYLTMAKVSRLVQSAKKVYLTPEGLQEAKAELNFLKTDKRTQIADRIEKAREFGDIDENSEYDAALNEQALVENRISYLEDILKNAKIISENPKSDFVVIGSTVKVEMDEGIDEFTIVGKVEANPAKKRISNESPLGSALLGAKVGDVVEVVTPIVRYKCKVVEVK